MSMKFLGQLFDSFMVSLEMGALKSQRPRHKSNTNKLGDLNQLT